MVDFETDEMLAGRVRQLVNAAHDLEQRAAAWARELDALFVALSPRPPDGPPAAAPVMSDDLDPWDDPGRATKFDGMP